MRAPGKGRSEVTTGDRGKQRRTIRWDVFVSHSWKDKGTATSLVEDLRRLHGCRVWVDYENLSRGAKLDERIREDLRSSRLVIVLWSKSARRSRWVTSELQAAAGYGCEILPCLLDKTSPEGNPILAGRLYCDFSSSFMRGLSEVVQKLHDDRDAAARSEQVLASHQAGRPEAFPEYPVGIWNDQEQVMDQIEEGKYREAARTQSRLNPIVDRLLKAFPRDPDVLLYGGYQKKNEYLVRVYCHPKDPKIRRQSMPLLKEAEDLFYGALSLRPHDIGAINGLGSVMALRGDMAMSEHFALRAAEAAKRAGTDYEAAQGDVERIRLRLRGRDDRGSAEGDTVVRLGAQGGSIILRFEGIAQALPVKVRNGLLSSLLGFAARLGQQGITGGSNSRLLVAVDPYAKGEAGYDPGAGVISVRPVWARDTDVIARLFALHVFTRMLAPRKAPDAAIQLHPLVSGLADYCACSFHDDPRLGKFGAPIVYAGKAPCLRDLRTKLRQSDLRPGEAPQSVGVVWAGAFWEMRERLGAGVADRLILTAWKTTCSEDPRGTLESRFVKHLLLLAETRGTEGSRIEVRRVLLQRHLLSARRISTKRRSANR